jgi:hypothetical protein
MTRTKGLVSFGRLAAVLIGITVALSGCNKVTGGGWMAGVNGGKANFGFQAQCQEVSTDFDEMLFPGFYEGQFQYRDNSAYVGFHGDINIAVTALFDGTCAELVDFFHENGDAANWSDFSGECVSHPGGVQGTFRVMVVDNGKAGPDSADEITVTTPNSVQQATFDDDGNQTGWEVVALGVPCTDNGQPYSNSGMLGGGNIAMPGPKNKK